MTTPFPPPGPPPYPPQGGPPPGYGSGPYGGYAEGGYAEGGYAEGGYGPYGGPGPYGGYGPAGPFRTAALNPIGTAVALLGGALVLLGAFLDWYDSIALGDIVNALDVDGAKAFPKAWFGWLMFVVLAATVVAALFATAPTGAAGVLRVVSPVLGLVGAGGVVIALNTLRENGSIFDNSAVGLYLTLFGFVIAGLGGVFGPSRARP